MEQTTLPPAGMLTVMLPPSLAGLLCGLEWPRYDLKTEKKRLKKGLEKYKCLIILKK